MRPALPSLFAGATFIALSPIFVRLADVGPTASAFWRVALAAPPPWVLAGPAPGAPRGRRCVRGRPGLRALVDPVHLRGELHAARESRLALRDAGAVALLAAAAEPHLPAGPCRRSRRRNASGA